MLFLKFSPKDREKFRRFWINAFVRVEDGAAEHPKLVKLLKTVEKSIECCNFRKF